MRFMDVLDKFKPKAEGSAELRTRLNEATAQKAAWQADVDAMQAKRGDTLIDGDTTTVSAFEADLRYAKDNLEAGTEIEATLARRLIAAERAEATASLQREAAAAAAESEAVTNLIQLRYAVLAAELSHIAGRELNCEARLNALHQRMASEAAKGIAIETAPDLRTPAERAWKQPGLPYSLASRMVLPSPGGHDADQSPFWPPAQERL